MSSILVLLIRLAIIILVIFLIRFLIKRGIKDLLTKLGMGNNSLSQIANAINIATEQTASTPKSITECEGMMLEKIKCDFPEFNPDIAREIVNSVIYKYFAALDEGCYIREVRDRCTEAFCDFADQQALDNERCYGDIKIHKTRITDYHKKLEEAVITFQTALEYSRHGETNQCVYETKYVYYLAENDAGENVSLLCKNCGAAISNVGMKFCEYCGAEIQASVERTWKVNKITKIR